MLVMVVFFIAFRWIHLSTPLIRLFLLVDNQKEIAEMQNETQKEIAGIQSATSRQNTKDQVYAQNEMLAYQQKESTARVASIMENTNLSKQQQVSEIMRQMLTQAQTAGQYFTNDQIKEMTRKVSAEVDLVHQQTQNQRYGSSHIGATAKDISNVVTDAASGVVDIFHGIDKAVSEIMRQMLTQAQTAGQYFTNDQIKEMTRKVSAEVDLVHQQTQNQRYGSSHIGATAKDISNVVTDAASGVVDIFHGIDKAVADTWNNFWKDGKADGIGSNLSRK